MEKQDMTLPDRLRLEGVNCLGYGVVPKYAMLDRDLSITAKAIYAYFCSMSGSGQTSFPGKETIQAHLKLGNEAYYKHREQLVEQGYLRIDRQRLNGREFSQNLYTLVSNPKKFEDKPPDGKWESAVYGLIAAGGIKAAGYGQIPRAVMCDGRLDAKAKAVYAYFASYAGAGRSAFPSVPKLLEDLGVSRGTYQKAMKALQECGLIEVRQRNGQSAGKRGFSVNDYYLLDSPQYKNPHTINPQTKKPKPIKPQAKKPQTTNPANIKNTFLTKNTSLTNIHPSPPADGMDAPLKKEDYEALIRESVFFEDIPLLSPRTDMKLVEQLVSLMASACAGEGTVRIGGEDIPKETVRGVFTRLEAEQLLYAIECVQRQKTGIRNIRAYYLTALFRAPETCEAYYDSLVSQDLSSP